MIRGRICCIKNETRLFLRNKKCYVNSMKERESGRFSTYMLHMFLIMHFLRVKIVHIRDKTDIIRDACIFNNKLNFLIVMSKNVLYIYIWRENQFERDAHVISIGKTLKSHVRVEARLREVERLGACLAPRTQGEGERGVCACYGPTA